jgi:hypothetical protein
LPLNPVFDGPNRAGPRLMNLTDLARGEHALLAAAARAVGSMEEKQRQLAETGVFEQYRAIHCAYGSLLFDPVAGPESLKRALFLGWYSVTEPACFTGILDVDRPTETAVLQVVNEQARTSAVDPELTWMLAWYHDVAAFYFEQGPYTDLLSFIRSCRLREPSQLDPDGFSGRGQMGHYWNSLAMSGRRTTGCN